MTNYDNQNNSQPMERRSRSRRSERSQQLFEARTFPDEVHKEQYQEPVNHTEMKETTVSSSPYQRPTESVSYAEYTPNEPETSVFGRESFQQTGRSRRRARYEQAVAVQPEQPEEISFSFVSSGPVSQENWDAYRRPGQTETAEQDGGEAQEDQFAYAPPVKLSFAGLDAQRYQQEEMPLPEEQSSEYGTANVYRPRVMDYSSALEGEEENIAPSEGYQVQEEAQPAKKKKNGLLIVLTALALIAAVVCLFLPEQLSNLFGKLTGKTPESTSSVAVVATPPPVKSYDAATPEQITSVTGNAISQISGTTEMQPHIVKETSILTRTPRNDGLFDFYLFSAKDGRLLAYFEKLQKEDAIPLMDGGYFIRQSPYLINEDGSPMIASNVIASSVQGGWVLHPMMNGWAQVTEEETGKVNFISREGQLLNRFWMSKVWPLTGEKTLGYVDTGNTADTEGRYSLYVMNRDGDCQKWRSEGDMDAVLFSACGAAYMDNGDLFLLDVLDTPLMTTDEVNVYVDCQAMVIRHPSSGKYALYVQGKQHYDFQFDEIRPVESDLNWHMDTYSGQGGSMNLFYVKDADYPQPLTHYFLLKTGDSEEYVALSTISSCPVVLE